MNELSAHRTSSYPIPRSRDDSQQAAAERTMYLPAKAVREHDGIADSRAPAGAVLSSPSDEVVGRGGLRRARRTALFRREERGHLMKLSLVVKAAGKQEGQGPAHHPLPVRHRTRSPVSPSPRQRHDQQAPLRPDPARRQGLHPRFRQHQRHLRQRPARQGGGRTPQQRPAEDRPAAVRGADRAGRAGRQGGHAQAADQARRRRQVRTSGRPRRRPQDAAAARQGARRRRQDGVRDAGRVGKGPPATAATTTSPPCSCPSTTTTGLVRRVGQASCPKAAR